MTTAFVYLSKTVRGTYSMMTTRENNDMPCGRAEIVLGNLANKSLELHKGFDLW